MQQTGTESTNTREYNVIDGNTIKTYSAYAGISFLIL
jgi:hypothetical protein